MLLSLAGSVFFHSHPYTNDIQAYPCVEVITTHTLVLGALTFALLETCVPPLFLLSTHIPKSRYPRKSHFYDLEA